MAKHSTSLQSFRESSNLAQRGNSHRILEGLLLFGALSLLIVLFSFLFLELTHIFSTNLSSPPRASSEISSQPPRVESRVVDSDLLLVEVSETGEMLRIIYQSDLSDQIADFTLFSIPQVNYQGIIYLRPLVEGDLPYLKVYPLTVSQGKLLASTLNVPADEFIASQDGSLVGVRYEHELFLYAIENGELLGRMPLPKEYAADGNYPPIVFDENSCLVFSSPIISPDEERPLLSPLCFASYD